jgi:hypothetical protein
MSKSMTRGPYKAPRGNASVTNTPVATATEDEELLLLALLDQLQSDHAAGRHPDLATYCAANPGLKDAFLSLALAMDLPDHVEESPRVEDSSREGRALSPGVLRALASIPDFARDADGPATASRPQRQAQVAEEPSNYDLESRATRTSKGDS